MAETLATPANAVPPSLHGGHFAVDRGVFSEFERFLIRERQKEGIALSR